MTDGKAVGYDINFNRYFYVYTPPRPLEKLKVISACNAISTFDSDLFGGNDS